MKRRAFVQLAVSAVALSPLRALALSGAADVLPAASLATLAALAPVVLPQSLGRRAIGLTSDRFVEWLGGYQPGVVSSTATGGPRFAGPRNPRCPDSSSSWPHWNGRLPPKTRRSVARRLTSSGG